ncbi:hypothetical protein BBH99_12955 [Chryseobacterium contaminans]|uniref:Thioredoxin n=1 Tax=Chryseobacterium contaminans TaxID=1423959 RepID=A0A1M6Z1W5_9FLAO|nr:thioredoxin fold domain-containing protein [Chryseobacterium contaminans]OCA72766.1 hypothetical protein BBH99_12955 [Chryseobacterium contaminans]SHL24362.1 Thioredoxin [Chryseobacterium contaminans]
MKKITAIFILSVSISTMWAQGINFEHGTFKEALAKAKVEKKLVFMDSYTTWCGPCKVMSKEIFPQQKVGDYINANFVSIKMDMEKGEGIELVKTYDVKAYPTLLFLDSDGKVLHRASGAGTSEDFLELAEIAKDPAKQMSTMEKQYKAGKRDLPFLAKYVKVLFEAFKNDECIKIGSEAISKMTPTQYLSDDGFTIIQCTGIKYKSKEYNYLLKNKSKFIAKADIGEKGYDYVMTQAISDYLNKVAKSAKSMDDLKKAIAETRKDFISQYQDVLERTVISEYYFEHKEYDTWFDFNKEQADIAFQKDKKSSLVNYINIAYNVAISPEFEKAGLYEKSINMLEGIKDINPNFVATNFCLANLYFKVGNKGKALENINYFLKKYEGKKEDPSAESIELKAKIEKM